MRAKYVSGGQNERTRPFCLPEHSVMSRPISGLLAVLAASVCCVSSVTAEQRNSPAAQPGSGGARQNLAKRPANGAQSPLARAPQDLEALALLRKKLLPTADFVAEQVTEVRNGRSSRERVIGDTRGRIRVDYIAPDDLAGDILLIGPERFANYHHASNTLDIAQWPYPWNDREKRIIAAVNRGRIAVRKTGEEAIAGRKAVIIELTSDGALGGRGGQIKYWIDPETNIQLKNEISNAGGFVSRTYMTGIVVGPAAGVKPRDFNPGVLRTAVVNPLFSNLQPPYHTLQEASAALPFTPFLPTALPTGYHLSGVWVFGNALMRSQGRGSVLLRYSDNLTSFSLFERRIANPEAKPIAPFRQNGQSIQRWTVTGANGVYNVLFIGHLSPEEVQTIHDSLH